MYGTIQIIAEVKTQSPFGWQSDKTWQELFEMANRIGDIISIHTDPQWGGSFELISKAKSLTRKPILAKGIHDSDELIQKAIDAGADWVLVVGRIPQIHLEQCFIEPLSLSELKTIPHHLKVVWNSRDLKTGGFKTETFAEVRNIFSGWLCQASHIKSVNDIQKGTNAVLVGTHLDSFANSLSKK